MNREEKKILAGLKDGHENAYRQLFNDYYVRLSLFANKYLNDLEISKEIVQDFFVQLFESRHDIIIHSSVNSYLHQSIKNKCLNYLKSQKRYQKRLEGYTKQQESEHEIFHKMEETELELKIHQIVSGLPFQCQKIFQMSRIDHKRNKEIAEELNISIRTVETQISKALKKIRSHLSGYLNLLIFIVLNVLQ